MHATAMQYGLKPQMLPRLKITVVDYIIVIQYKCVVYSCILVFDIVNIFLNKIFMFLIFKVRKSGELRSQSNIYFVKYSNG